MCIKTAKHETHKLGVDRVFMLRQVLYISLCLNRLNKQLSRCTELLCFVPTGAKFFLIV